MMYSVSNATGILLVALVFAPQAVSAAEDIVSEPELSGPDLELLEFLGRFETDSGEWLNPTELLEPEFDQLLRGAEDQQKESPGPSDNSEPKEKQSANQDDD